MYIYTHVYRCGEDLKYVEHINAIAPAAVGPRAVRVARGAGTPAPSRPPPPRPRAAGGG